MARRRTLPSRSILACFAIAAYIQIASAQTYYFTGAVTVQQGGSGYSPAQQAVCPSGYENRCDDIGASGYCCPAADTCSWANSQVMCCASGHTCSGYGSGDGAYHPTSYYPPQTSTVYYQPSSYYAPPPATTVYAAGGAGGYQESQPPAYGGYCSTYYAQGPNLPTTRQGECGTVLVIEPGEGVRWAIGWVRLVGMLGLLHLVGGVVFVWR